MYELIITEKPNAAKKIAEALADGKAIRETNQGVYYYKLTHGKKDLVVACAVGHLYGLAESEKKSWTYPVFAIEWKPVAQTTKGSSFTAKYLNTLKKLSKGASSFTVATDYDIEGEVIGLNVVRFVCRQKDANRMKFSTLTKPDLIKAYEGKNPSLDWGLANAGETRHFLDFFNGVSYSRALTSAIKTTGSFKLMSTGRVQGPALKIIVDREREIMAFKPVPFWEIGMLGDYKNEIIKASHKEGKFWEKQKADAVIEKTKNRKEAKVKSIEKREFGQMPPFPFDLTSLQVEAYRCFGIQPKETLQIAQEIYTSGFISYPRTSSQQLPDSIGYEKILSDLSAQKQYSALAKNLLGKKLVPNNGKKTDPAHPAIYPTGIEPGEQEEREMKIYDLIVKRFLSTFAENATRETVTVEIDCNEEIFVARGTRTVKKGWHIFYSPYVHLEEVEMPHMNQGDMIKVNKIELESRETQPPKRYTPASIIKELEKRNLGTKATRSEIVDTLFKRGYVSGKAVEATGLGISTIETLEKYCPKIIDEELTRHFEIEMEKVREKRQSSEKILKDAKDSITKILDDFKKNQKEIGEGLARANMETRHEMSLLGKCDSCSNGSLHIRKGKNGYFAACSGYPDCRAIFSLPSNCLLKPAKKICEICSFPMITAIKKGKRPQDFCINPECRSKHAQGVAGEEAKAVAKGEIEKPCPKCGSGKIVLRKSIYGSFYGCNKFPKCRYTQSLSTPNH